MRTFTATIQLNVDQEYLLQEAAEHFGLSVQDYLTEALASGLSHTEDIWMGRAQTETEPHRKSDPGDGFDPNEPISF